MIRLSFHGAAETVTGSRYLLETADGQALIDCGMFQGLRELRERNWLPFPFDAKKLPAVVLTHAHIDHSGCLPRLVRAGFNGPIYCTPATAELVELLLFDSAHNQEEDADYANRKGYSRHRPAEPLYDNRDVSRTIRLLRPIPRGEWIQVDGPIWSRFVDVGHLLGSAMVQTEIRQNGKPTRILFSGDVGRYNAPLYFDPQPPTECDYLICESTYGDRDHSKTVLLDELEEVIQEAMRRGGVVVAPAFAVGRAQQLIYLLLTLIHHDRLPEIPIYLDSPMAVDATRIYREYADEHDLSEAKGLASAFTGRNVHLARTAAESKRINSVEGPAIIISSSGMMVGGRILHHLRHRLPDPKNTIMLAGFMAEGTRGRALKDGARFLRMHGMEVPVRCAIREITALSGHADRGELMRWLSGIGAPRQVFLTHGELTGSQAFAAQLREARGWNVTIPKMNQSFELDARQK